MKTRILIIMLIIAVLLTLGLAGCANQEKNSADNSVNQGKIKIIATLFPQYDFAKQIAGDKAVVTLLLPPGVESHSYEPKPSDIIKINDADLFVYTGEYMEVWVHSILEGIEKPHGVILDVSKGIDLVYTEHIETGNSHQGEEEESEDDHLYDPHIWTDPNIAKAMVNNILEALCEIDPDNAGYFKLNAESYLAELTQLDSEFRFIVEKGTRDEMVFGSKFALLYFTKQYGLSYEAAFDSCSTETEPSAKTVAHLISKIQEEKIPVVYYAEIIEPKVAKSISDETGAKMLLFHSCHNVTKEEFDEGATYLSLMKQNARNLKEGLY